MRITSANTARTLNELETLPVVDEILRAVKRDGDKAVRKYTKQFDNLDVESFELTRKDIAEAYTQVDKKTIEAIKTARTRIQRFAEAQMQLQDFEMEEEGVIIGQKVVPLKRVGCYVPGGRYPLPSTALMLVVPAKVTGVGEITVCSPKIQPATIVAADIAGADRIFTMGGIQAIGAMAYGTAKVPRVDKIVGPGNKYVTAAKKAVYGIVGIDFIAGPSEVMIIADESANATLVAADLLAQAEHDPNARADLVTTSRKLAKAVQAEVKRQLADLPTKDIAREAINNSQIVLVSSLKEAAVVANERAPEHLELQITDCEEIIPLLVNYGSLFVGEYAAEVFGDYCTGTNHTLPTNGAARYTGGLSVKDFVKVLTYQKLSQKGADKLSKTAVTLAQAEGLEAHRRAALLRTKGKPETF